MNSRLEQSCRTLKRVSALAALMAASLVGRAEEFTVLQGGGALDITDRSLTSSTISNGTNIGPIQRVRANLSGLTHTDPDDLDVLLVFERDIIDNNDNETRRGFLLLSDTGGQSDIKSVNLTIDSQAGSNLPDTTSITSGSFKPTNFNGGAQPGVNDAEAADANAINTAFGLQGDQRIDELAPTLDSITQFVDGNGTQGKGTWTLFVLDDREVGSGSLSGWSVELQAAPRFNTINEGNPIVLNEDSETSVSLPLLDNGASSNLNVFVQAQNRINGDGALFDTNSRLAISGSGSTRTLTVDPKADLNGEFDITLRVADGPVGNGNAPANANVLFTETTIRIRVDAVNDAPTITGRSDITIPRGGSVGPFVVEVDDAASAENETPDGNLVVTGRSENGTLIDSNDIFITPHNDANKRNVFLFTSGTGSGPANIVLTVTDGANATGTTRFRVNVSDSPEIGVSDTNSINAQGDINVATAQIDQFGDSANLSRLKVILRDVNIAIPENVELKLRAPSGDEVILMKGVGGQNPIVNGHLTFQDGVTRDDGNGNAIPNDLPNNAAVPQGQTWIPTDHIGANQTLADFGLEAVNGTWSLIATGMGGGDSITDGFSLIIEQAPIFTSFRDGDGNIGNGLTFNTNEDQPVSFTIDLTDADTPLADVTLSATSSDQAIIPNGNITFTSISASRRRVTVSPASNQFGGPVNISLTIADAGNPGFSQSTRVFQTTVAPQNDAPQLAFIDRQVGRNGDIIGPVNLTVTDIDPGNTLTVSAVSSNDKLVPNDANHIVITGGSNNGTNVGVSNDPFQITLFPVPFNEDGSDQTTNITVTISDGTVNSSPRVFELAVRPANTNLRADLAEFSITDDGLTTRTRTINDVNGTIESVSVTLAGLNHSEPDDLEILLVGPDGTGVILMSGVGGALPVGGALGSNFGLDNGIQLVFSSLGGQPNLPVGGQLMSGLFAPTNASGLNGVAGAPAAPAGNAYTSDLTRFQGKSANGTWTLYIHDTDKDNNHYGRMAQGWSVNIQSRPFLSGLPDSTSVTEDKSVTIPFTFGDNQAASDGFQVAAVSQNGAIIPNPTVTKTGLGAGSLQISPAANQNTDGGNPVNVVVTVTDANGNNAVTKTIAVTVNADDDAPEITFLNPANVVADGIVTAVGIETDPIVFRVTDIETAPNAIDISVQSSTAGLIQAPVIEPGPNPANEHMFKIVPNGLQPGTTQITVTAVPSAGGVSTSRTFTLTVSDSIVSAAANSNTVVIPPVGTSAPSDIKITGLVGKISSVRVVFVDLQHTFPNDLDITLESPGGAVKRSLMVNAGGGTPIDPPIRLQLEDNPALGPLPTPLDNASGRYNQAVLRDFVDLDPNGTWRLQINDRQAPDEGSLGAWYLVLTTSPVIEVDSLVTTGFVRDGRPDPDLFFRGITSLNEDQTASSPLRVSFTVGDSDSSVPGLNVTAASYDRATFRNHLETGAALPGGNGGSALIPVTFDNDNNRTDLVLGGTGSKRTLDIRLAANKNTDGLDKKGGDGANKDDAIDPNNDVDEAVIRLVVSDGTTQEEAFFLLFVNDVNDAPTIANQGIFDPNGQNGTVSVNEDGTVTFDFVYNDLEDAPTLPNPRGARATFGLTSNNQNLLDTASNAPGFAFIDDGDGQNATQRVRLTPKPNQNGQAVITLSVTDDDPSKPLTTSRNITFNVNSVNDLPQLGSRDNDGNLQNGFISNFNLSLANPGGGTQSLNVGVNDVDESNGNLTVVAKATSNPGILPLGGILTSRVDDNNWNIAFNPSGLTVGNVDVTVAVRDSAGAETPVTFTVNISQSPGEEFTNPNPITLFDNSSGLPYPSVINVPAAAHRGDVAEVYVTLNGLRHGNPDDLDIILEHNGIAVALMSDAGGSTNLPASDLLFSDSAGSKLPDSGTIAPGTYQPSNFEGTSDSLPAPAPAPGNNGYSVSLAAFNGTAANGNWNLYIADDTSNQVIGALEGGWSLSLVTAPIINGIAAQATGEDTQLVVPVGGINQTQAPAQLRYSATSNNQSLVPNSGITVDNNVPNLTLNPAPNASGTATITVTTTDERQHTDSTTFVLTVNQINDDPTITGLPRTNAPGQGPVPISEGSTRVVSFTVSDIETADGDITVTAVSSDPVLIPIANGGDNPDLVVDPSNSSGRLLTLRPAAERSGPATITVTVNDGSGGVINATFDVNVTVENDPPTITGPATASVRSGGAVTVGVTVDDPDFGNAIDNLTLSATSSNTGLVEANGFTFAANLNDGAANVAGGTIGKVTIDGNEIGRSNLTIQSRAVNLAAPETVNIVVTVTDDGNNTASFTIALEVRPSTNRIYRNDSDGDNVGDLITIVDRSGADPAPADPYPSSIIIDDKAIRGTVGAIQVRLSGITHSFPGDIDAMVVGPNGKGVILTSDNGSSGRLDDITLTFSDAAANNLLNNNNIGSGVWKPTNNNPQGEPDNFPADPALPTDPANILTSLNDAFLGLDPNGTWRLFVADDAQVDAGSIARGWEIILQTRPVIDAIATQTIDEGTTSDFTFPVFDDDSPSGSLVLAAVSDNQAVIANGDLDPKITANGGQVTLKGLVDGVANITVTLTDEDNHVATRTFQVTVNDVPQGPVIAGLPAAVEMDAGSTQNVGFTISDADTAVGSLTVSATSDNDVLLPNSALVVTQNGGAITLAVTPVGSGAGTVTVEVSDGSQTATGSFTVLASESHTFTFTSEGGITINEVGKASPYGEGNASISVLDLAGNIRNLKVNLTGLQHSFSSDIDMLLVGPSGETALLLSDVGSGGTGGTVPPASVDLEFMDGAGVLTRTAPIVSGTFRPSDSNAGQSVQDNVFPDLSQTPPFGDELGDINGAAGGVYQLFVVDDTEADSGSIDQWSISVTTSVAVIAGIPNQTVQEGSSIDVPVTVFGPFNRLSVSSSDQSVVPLESLSVNGSNVGISIPTRANPGTSTITVTAINGPKGNTKEVTQSFLVTVEDVNTAAPQISSIDNETLLIDELPLAVPFTVSDSDTPAGEIDVGVSIVVSPGLPDLGPTQLLRGPMPATSGIMVLGGFAEVPPVTTGGIGEGTFILTDTELFVDVSYGNLSTPLSAAHIHGPASASENAGVLVDLSPTTGGTSGRIRGTFAIDATTRDHIRNGQTYINLHTEGTPSGEIRGQLQVRELNTSKYELTFNVAVDGVVPVTITATDTNGVATTESFQVEVIDNEPSTLVASATSVSGEIGSTEMISLTLGDTDTPLDSIALTATTSNASVVRNSGLVLGGAGADRTLAITPNGSGRSTITVTANDGIDTTVVTIELVVQPRVNVARNGDNIAVSWQGGFLESAPTPTGPWTEVQPIPGVRIPGPASVNLPIQGDQLYFRTVQ